MHRFLTLLFLILLNPIQGSCCEIHKCPGSIYCLQASIGEILSISASLSIYPFPDRKIDKAHPGPNVLLIHGYLHNTSPWGWFRSELQKSGMGSVNTVYYPSFCVGVLQASCYVQRKIDFLNNRGQFPDILIGHSVGGLVALEYALTYAPKDRIITVIALASPLEGTQLAKIAAGPIAEEILPHSPYLQSLHQRLKYAPHIRFLALSSAVDEIIRPPQNAIWIDFPYQVFPNLGHVQFLFSRNVVKTCVCFINSEKQ